ncbi:histone-lysine N-methyltransferase SETMAR [Trichonephila clavipes]|uniref:Histone-lysine N-methyltransferase SETMAR n=1 Tax=Trichonephila clavipes TaxID=2585209 RepID=A0A8X6V4C6_TRICX|nr:histone-lysine N-methyltransferase SETMAR [Trichonephila clavipes]
MGEKMPVTNNAKGRPSVITDDLMQAFETKILVWAPTENTKRKGLPFPSLDFLIRYEEEGDDMLNRIVTGDETLVAHITPKSKQHSVNGDTHPLPSKPNKLTVKAQDYGNSVLGPARCFAGGLSATRNEDHLGCLLRNSTEAPKSIAKRRGMPSKGVLFFHDNARPHFSNVSGVKSFGWEVLYHTLHSSDLAPGDFHIFRYLKQSWREAFH